MGRELDLLKEMVRLCRVLGLVVALRILFLGVVIAPGRIGLGRLVDLVPEGIEGVLDVLDLRYSSNQFFLRSRGLVRLVL